MDWQRRSGRLENPDNQTVAATIEEEEKDTTSTSLCYGDEISEDSWFGYMNLGFTVAVYCGAAKAGLMPKVQCFCLKSNQSGAKPMNIEKNEGFQLCVNHWEAFWIGPHQRFLAEYSSLKNEKVEMNVDDIVYQKKKEEESLCRLYERLWNTHTQIIQTLLPYAKRLEQFMPPFERKFGLGWCHMVELLASMSWTFLSLDALMEIGAGYLPTIVLTDESALNFLKTKSKKEHKFAIDMINMSYASSAQMFLICAFLERLAYWDTERKCMPSTLKILSHPTESTIWDKILVRCRVLSRVVYPHSGREWGLWCSLLFALHLLARSRFDFVRRPRL